MQKKLKKDKNAGMYEVGLQFVLGNCVHIKLIFVKHFDFNVSLIQ